MIYIISEQYHNYYNSRFIHPVCHKFDRGVPKLGSVLWLRRAEYTQHHSDK